MKKRIILFCIGLVLFLTGIGITSCYAADVFKQKDDILIEALAQLNQVPDRIVVGVGEKKEISSCDYKYTISSNDIAAITKDNKVFGVSVGTQNIIVINQYGQSKTIKVFVQINEKNSPNTIYGTTAATKATTKTSTTELSIIKTTTESSTTTISTSTTTKTTTITTTEKEITTTTTEKVIEKIVYKSSTHYVHRSTCSWASSGCYEITTTEGLEARLCDECNPDIEIITLYEEPTTSNLSFVKTFTRGTFYAYGAGRTGGSGRSLIDCSWGNGTVKGSIASSYLYHLYGYNYNGRTMVYLEVRGYPSMNGYYYLDDCDAGNSNVIDFFYYYGSNCQFYNQGVVSVDCYIVR